MKKFIRQNIKSPVAIILFLMVNTALLYAYPEGVTGRTLKTSTSGCGGCHGSTPATDVIVTISGPDTLTTGQTGQYTLTISKASKSGAGLDIAVRSGALNAVSSNIHLSNGELTHNANISMTNGSVMVQFGYTAPSIATTDTIWATGLATNSNNNTSGDDWNWASRKRVVVRTLTAINNISNKIPGSFSLMQNFPNPFNPSTKIRFNVPKNSFVKLSIFDMSGKEVDIIANGELSAGEYEVNWNPRNLASGLYFYTLKAADFSETKRMILIK
ncbi:MAG: T9SS C-terminal target domain-containing protein [Ignavibacteriae bacterium]|nr:MAG: T9SS C-terminal target domain-containing protein [Ignavibacteriota bacterium]